MGASWDRWRFLAAVVLPAGILMALEMVSSRLLAPQFGNSVYVWGSIIGVFLAAMSAGYVLGGRLADRKPELPVLGLLLLLAGLLQWGTALYGRSAVRAIGELSAGRPAGTLLVTALLFGPATLLLATVSPYAVRIAGLERARLGNVAGGLFALSTFGSLAGTLLATFVLIPSMSLDRILALLVAATAASALLLLERSGPRLAAVALGVAAFLPFARDDAGPNVLVERATPYQTIVVRELGGRRQLFSDGTPHGEIDVASGAPTLSYMRAAEAPRLFQPDARKALLLGLGSGSVGKIYVDGTPGLVAKYVEIDPAMVEVARRHFDFKEGERLSVEVTDGRRFLAETPDLWDWVYCDTYIGQAVPFHLATREFFALLRSRLAPGGLVALNLAGSVEHPFSRSIYRTLKQVFRHVETFAIRGSGNFLFIAHDGEAVPDSELRRRAEALDLAASPNRFGLPFTELAHLRIAQELELESVPILVDGFAPVDSLLNLGDPRPRFGADVPPVP